MLITSVPVFAIVVRYNLLRGDICSTRMAIFLSAVLPWLFAIPFQTRVRLLWYRILKKLKPSGRAGMDSYHSELDFPRLFISCQSSHPIPPLPCIKTLQSISFARPQCLVSRQQHRGNPSSGIRSFCERTVNGGSLCDRTVNRGNLCDRTVNRGSLCEQTVNRGSPSARTGDSH